MNPREGQTVSFIGDPIDGAPAIGDRGKVLALAGSGSHVLWNEGSRKAGEVDLVPNIDLVAQGAAHSVSADFADSVTMGPMVSFAVRETFEADGEVGLLNALAESGNLSGFAQIAEEAASFVAGRLRSDEEFSSVIAQLDESEAASLVSLASAVLLRDAFGEDGDG